MITAKQIIKFHEEYFGTKNVSGRDVVIYKNPTLSDLTQIKSREVRFIANNKTHEVFIWDANLAIHMNIWQTVTSVSLMTSDHYPNYLSGIAQISGGSLKITGWDMFKDFSKVFPSNRKTMPVSVQYFTTVFSYNWSWLDKYFKNGSTFIDACKIQFYGLLK
jgi:hypothetical protein